MLMIKPSIYLQLKNITVAHIQVVIIHLIKKNEFKIIVLVLKTNTLNFFFFRNYKTEKKS